MRLFGGATDTAALLPAPFLVAPFAIALALGGLLALFLLNPEAAPVSALLILPTAWGYYAVLALPLIVKLQRKLGLTPALLVAVVAMSAILPIVNIVLPLTPGTARVAGSPASIVAVSFLALQPIGYAILVASAARWGRSQARTGPDAPGQRSGSGC